VVQRIIIALVVFIAFVIAMRFVAPNAFAAFLDGVVNVITGVRDDVNTTPGV
jgi:hypothetical protein